MGVPLVCKCGNRTEASAEFLALHGLRCAQCQRRMMPQAWAEGRVRKVGNAAGGQDGEEVDLLEMFDQDLLAALDVGLREQARKESGKDSLAAGFARAAVAAADPAAPARGRSGRVSHPVLDAEQRTRRMVGLGLMVIGGGMSAVLAVVAVGVAYGPVALFVFFLGIGATVGGGVMIGRSR